MSAYCLFQNIKITDPMKMNEYVEKVKPITQSFGGEYVVMGGKTELKEGHWLPILPVIIKFPDMNTANAWYDSEEYQPLKELRKSAGEFSAVFIDELPA
jgi:uncharacterized protein (DUF1330 family)